MPDVTKTRARSSSYSQQLKTFAANPNSAPDTPLASPNPSVVLSKQDVKPDTPAKPSTGLRQFGLLDDLCTWRWMIEPSSSLKIISIVVSLWAIWSIVMPSIDNPFSHLLFISHPLPQLPTEDVQYYSKGWYDFTFLLFYIVVFSFIRQSATRYIIRPLAIKGGIRGTGKLERFMEQGYAIMYWGTASVLGIYVMYQQESWWYDTKHFWLEYPHWRLRPELKAYYLVQFAYWLQQLLVLALKLEKPRSDYMELCCHHIVTLWLIGWSYGLNLTMIGVPIFVSMDIPDVFLAISKSINYLKWQRTSEVTFGIFLAIWTYFRHYQNLRILWSVWYEFDLIPDEMRIFDLRNGIAAVGWMKYQVFTPILLLQFLNLFWYFLMWRIVVRMLIGIDATDTREADEESDDEMEKKEQ